MVGMTPSRLWVWELLLPADAAGRQKSEALRKSVIYRKGGFFPSFFFFFKTCSLSLSHASSLLPSKYLLVAVAVEGARARWQSLMK